MTDALSALKSIRAKIATWQRYANVGVTPSRVELSEALREADDAIAACGWREIADAPTDGTVILARYQWLGQHRFMVIHREALIDRWIMDGTSQCVGHEIRGMRPVEFTHWKPIDAPPAALRQIEGKAE